LLFNVHKQLLAKRDANYVTVDAAAAVEYCTPKGAAQIRPANRLLHNHCPNSIGFTEGFSDMIVDYHFSQKKKLFFLSYVLPLVLTA